MIGIHLILSRKENPPHTMEQSESFIAVDRKKLLKRQVRERIIDSSTGDKHALFCSLTSNFMLHSSTLIICFLHHIFCLSKKKGIIINLIKATIIINQVVILFSWARDILFGRLTTHIYSAEVDEVRSELLGCYLSNGSC